jgi:hypothetical protein
VDGNGAERGRIEAEVVETGESFRGEEVAAHLVVSGNGTLDESDAATGQGELDGCGGAGGTAADDDGVEVVGSPANPGLRSDTRGTVAISPKYRGLSTPASTLAGDPGLCTPACGLRSR